MKPMRSNANLAPVLFLLLVVAGIFLYAIKFYKPVETEEVVEETPVQKEFNVVEFIDKSIENEDYKGARYGSSQLLRVKHFPKVKMVKFSYDVGGFSRTPIATAEARSETVRGLLSKACTHESWQKVLKAGYKMVHQYNTRDANRHIASVEVNAAKCMHRNYPGRNLEEWNEVIDRGDIVYKSFGPAEGSSKLYTAK